MRLRLDGIVVYCIELGWRQSADFVEMVWHIFNRNERKIHMLDGIKIRLNAATCKQSLQVDAARHRCRTVHRR